MGTSNLMQVDRDERVPDMDCGRRFPNEHHDQGGRKDNKLSCALGILLRPYELCYAIGLPSLGSTW